MHVLPPHVQQIRIYVRNRKYPERRETSWSNQRSAFEISTNQKSKVTSPCLGWKYPSWDFLLERLGWWWGNRKLESAGADQQYTTHWLLKLFSTIFKSILSNIYVTKLFSPNWLLWWRRGWINIWHLVILDFLVLNVANSGIFFTEYFKYLNISKRKYFWYLPGWPSPTDSEV